MIRGEPISRCLSELDRTQWYSYEELKELQLRKLKIMLHHCYNRIPFYKIIFSRLNIVPEDIKTIEDFRIFPFLTKENIWMHKDELFDTNFKGRLEHCHSGGTQGRPLELVRDVQSSAYARAALFRCLGWYGIQKADKQLRIWGMPSDNKLASKEKRKDFLLNRIRISAFNIGQEKIAEYIDVIRKFKPRYIYGYVSSVYRVCQLMKKNNIKGDSFNIGYVITTAENLDTDQRRFIEEFLRCRVINEYGCGEIGPIAHECPEGNLHINMENVLVEFIESETYGEGNSEIVLTNLNSFSMPLLRYKIYDTGQALNSTCSCGRGLALMGFNAGRVISTLLATSGHFVACSFFRYLASEFIKKYKGIKDFRVVQKQRNRLEITLSQDENFNESILNLFSSKIREILGSDMKIDYIFQDEIPLEKSGKRLYVYSELKEILER